MTFDEMLSEALPKDCRWHVGHIPHFYRDDEIPKLLRKLPYEAYLARGMFGTKTWIFVSSEGATPADALLSAILRFNAAVIAKAEEAQQEPKKKRR